ncbi:GspH/FimT family protein [Sedimenticola selenatireducens]|uniref:Type II secretion system protein H n=1 Tax=Sedimenticola selenatireducens TaxID=191960 RepID=A0A558DRP0_9GAMM|nr:GspH/FimT family pseudopilin [Sedimenticola selenatireducens]TVO75807.1 prepilin-type N-terminal cleavage/methylation domain-containing protein [Sedimenticola selenatireducens]TVT63666.1 MAG: prepilin-type N-terminal cleavage/methylation domain-containing protein [Sedimenticola selenatireducens]
MKSHVIEPASSCAGLTLIELLITLAIGAITLTMAVPAMGSLIGNNARASAINTLVSHIQLARSEAIARGGQTILCPSINGSTCLNTTRWNDGYILVADKNGNKYADSDDEVVRVFEGLDQRITITSTSNRKKILFNWLGMTPGYNLTLSFCDRQQTVTPKAVIVSNTGRPRLSDKQPDGTPIDCS